MQPADLQPADTYASKEIENFVYLNLHLIRHFRYPRTKPKNLPQITVSTYIFFYSDTCLKF